MYNVENLQAPFIARSRLNEAIDQVVEKGDKMWLSALFTFPPQLLFLLVAISRIAALNYHHKAKQPLYYVLVQYTSSTLRPA